MKIIIKSFSEIKKLLRKGFFHLFFSNFLIQFMVFGSQMLVAGLISPEDLGRVKVLQTIIDVSAIIAGAGLVVAILKLIPENDDRNSRKFILQFSLKNAFLFSLFIFIFLNLLSYFNLLSSDGRINSLFPGFSIVILMTPISLILVRYYQALDHFKKVSVIQLVTKVFSVILIILFTFLFLVKGYILGVVLGYLLTLIYLLYDLRADVFTKAKVISKESLIKEIKFLSKFNFLGQVSDRFRVYAGFFIANYFILDREVFGQYSFALILIQGLGVISSSVQQFLIPKFSKLSKNKINFFNHLRSFEIKYFIVAIFVFILGQLLIPWLVDFIFEGKYKLAVSYFRVLFFGWLIYSAFTLKGVAFIGLGRVDLSFKTSFFVLLMILPITILLCSVYGIWGILIAYIIQSLFSLILSTYYIKRIRNS